MSMSSMVGGCSWSLSLMALGDVGSSGAPSRTFQVGQQMHLAGSGSIDAEPAPVISTFYMKSACVRSD